MQVFILSAVSMTLVPLLNALYIHQLPVHLRMRKNISGLSSRSRISYTGKHESVLETLDPLTAKNKVFF